MMPTDTHNRQVVLKRRPVGAPTVDDFAMVELPVPQPSDGEVLTRTAWLSLDPYMRGRMSDRKSYAPSVPLGGVMVARTVSRVIESRDPRFAPGDIVLGPGGWQDYAALPAASLRKLDPEAAPVSTALGVLGMPGMTAYVGLLDLGRPRAGETVVVSAASGAVGSVAGQSPGSGAAGSSALPDPQEDSACRHTEGVWVIACYHQASAQRATSPAS